MGQIKELQEICHHIAKSKGFYDGYDIPAEKSIVNIERNPCELLMLMVSELAEAMEALRSSKPEDNNLGEELADCIIRIFDASEYWGINLEFEILKKIEKNKLRPRKHGKKF